MRYHSENIISQDIILKISFHEIFIFTHNISVRTSGDIYFYRFIFSIIIPENIISRDIVPENTILKNTILKLYFRHTHYCKPPHKTHLTEAKL